jgi:hypothetical protein
VSVATLPFVIKLDAFQDTAVVVGLEPEALLGAALTDFPPLTNVGGGPGAAASHSNDEWNMGDGPAVRPQTQPRQPRRECDDVASSGRTV